jgi:hypothetical protein
MKPMGVRVLLRDVFTSDEQAVGDARMELLLRTTHSSLEPSFIRLSSGNQIIGNSYTLGASHMLEGGEEVYIAELCIREGPVRVRVKFGFATSGVPHKFPIMMNNSFSYFGWREQSQKLTILMSHITQEFSGSSC